MRYPLVSVITPCYNGEPYIAQTIESVLAQTFTNWEMLIVNDGSTDKSREIIQTYAERDRRVYLLEHPDGVNTGVSASRNLAIHHARGTYLAFLDADDVWLAHKLERQVAVLERYPDVGLIYSQAQCIDEIGEPLTHSREFLVYGVIGHGTPDIPLHAYAELLSGQVAIPNLTVVTKKDCVLEAGGFPLNLTYQVEDLVVWARIARRAALYYIAEPLALYRLRANSFTGQLTRLTALDARWEAWVNVPQSWAEPDPQLAKVMFKFVDRYLMLRDVPRRVRWRRAINVTRFLYQRSAVTLWRIGFRLVLFYPFTVMRRYIGGAKRRLVRLLKEGR